MRIKTSSNRNQCKIFPFPVTVARAVELKHNASLISALANETSKLFQDAANTLKAFGELSAQWIMYLELKSAFYQSYVSNILNQSQNLFLLSNFRPSRLTATAAKTSWQWTNAEKP